MLKKIDSLRRTFFFFVIGSCLLAATPQIFAQNEQGWMNGVDEFDAHNFSKPEVITDADLFHAESSNTVGLVSFSVRIISIGGDVVFEEQTEAASVTVLIGDLGLPNGKYRYEVDALYETGEVTDLSAAGGTTSRKEFGRFKIDGGFIDNPNRDEDAIDRETSSIEQASWPVRLPGTAIGWLVPSAHAANVTVSSTFPTLIFDDTDDSCCEWYIRTPNTGTTNTFVLQDLVGANGAHEVISIFGDNGSTLNQDSLVVDAAGDMSLGDGSMFIDRSTGGVNIGATTPGNGQLQLTSSSAAILSMVGTGGDQNYLYQNGNGFGINEGSGSARFWIWNGAPALSLVVDTDGDVGVGSISPSAPLHVTRANKTAQLKVTDTSVTPGNLNLLQLENAGGAQVGFNDTTRPYQWNFIGGRDFKINATTFADTEFVMTPQGNLTILGALSENSDVNAKEKIVPVDRYDVLSKIASLPIAEWSYIDTPQERHIGPMAQDFYAAFGLGQSDTLIATLDTAGVALAGIQALIKDNDALKAQNSALSERLELLESQQVEMQAVMMQVLENQQPQNVLTSTVLN